MTLGLDQKKGATMNPVYFVLDYIKRAARETRGDHRHNDDADWRHYAFADDYDYTLQGAWWTCEKCHCIARRYLENSKVATCCESCGAPGYWVGVDWHNRDGYTGEHP